MKYKLVCSDLDGSFLDWDGNVPKENIEALKALSEEGVIFAICTGRPLNAVNLLAKQIGISPYIVCLNGAIVQTDREGDLLRHECFPETELDVLLEIGKRSGSYPLSFGYKDGLITDSSDETYETRVYSRLNEKAKSGPYIEMIVDESDTKDIFRQYADQYCKILFWFDTVEHCKEASKEIAKLDRYDLSGGLPINIELTKKGVNKWTGIEVIMKEHGISADEVICIGDSLNDADMIKQAGLGVAMANAQDGVEEIADVVTDTNENAGVAKIIFACLRGEYDS